MELSATQSLSFIVTRKNPELIAPAKPTPHEFKVLSDIDDQVSLRFHVSAIRFFRGNPSAQGKDPVKVIRDAIAKALVFYYPFAGRLRECSGDKLVVDCTGEGVMFIEANADVTLQQFGDPIYPPYSCTKELLYDVAASSAVLHSPLLLIQVTRLKCGGFVFGIRFTHTMCDGHGLAQFMTAIGEIARGAEAPSVLPTWDRHLLCAREPLIGDVIIPGDANETTPLTELDAGMVMLHRSFFFGAAELSALRSRLPPRLRDCSNFDLVTSCLWRCRTIALATDPEQEFEMLFTWNFRKLMNPPLPGGYYGNVMVLAVATATADQLSRNPLHHAVELVRKSKREVAEEFKKSSVQEMILKGQQHFMGAGSYTVSDLTRYGFEAVDFGWGESSGSPAEDNFFASFYFFHKKSNGDAGRMVHICLPPEAMDVFARELQKMITDDRHQANSSFIKSPL